jgi:uncharacterized protein with von Willebrand factor type A (vWA) domain
VRAVDTLLEDSFDKDFSSEQKGLDFITDIVLGESRKNPLTRTVNPGQLVTELAQSPAQLTKSHTRGKQAGGKDPDAAPFNLRPVAEVLAQYGLDPFAEIAKVLMDEVPILKRDGTPELDDDGKPRMRVQVAGVDRAKVLTELAQYVTPKLKAVEMKVEDRRKWTDEELDERIAGLMAKLGGQVPQEGGA